MLVASVIQDQADLATQVLEVVSTQGLAAARIPDQVVGHLQLPVVARIQDLEVERTLVRVAVPIPDQEAALIPAPVVVATAGRAVVAQINGIGLILIAS